MLECGGREFATPLFASAHEFLDELTLAFAHRRRSKLVKLRLDEREQLLSRVAAREVAGERL